MFNLCIHNLQLKRFHPHDVCLWAEADGDDNNILDSHEVLAYTDCELRMKQEQQKYTVACIVQHSSCIYCI